MMTVKAPVFLWSVLILAVPLLGGAVGTDAKDEIGGYEPGQLIPVHCLNRTM